MLACPLWSSLICAATSRADLIEFIKRPDPAFSWKLKGKTETAQGIVYDLHLSVAGVAGGCVGA